MWRCFWCLTTTGPFNKDHVRPKCLSGSKDPDNIVLSCVECNNERSLMTNYRGQMLVLKRRLRANKVDSYTHGIAGFLRRELNAHLEVQRKWTAVETERLGHSPSAKINLSPEKVLALYENYELQQCGID